MTHRLKTCAAVIWAVALAAAPGIATAATIDGWNTDNVVVGATPADGVTGYSVVYDRDVTSGTAGATTSGQIAFTPPEAVSPGIQVATESYTRGTALDGCLMTSNSGATCSSDFQSGKRIKQQMTGLGPVDLVFDVSGSTDMTYQVFHRLINVTGGALSGFQVELGYGTGGNFMQAGATGPLTFSASFEAQPNGSGPVSTQYPFGLFGDAATNSNFTLDGFFAPERTGMTVNFASTVLSSTGYFGPYDGLFGDWLSQDAVPMGAFWDNDANDSTDALLMAWFNPATGKWEARREAAVLDTNGTGTAQTLATILSADTLAEIEQLLGMTGLLDEAPIEDLANLNLNFAIHLAGDLGGASSFTLRTTVLSAVPLPAGAPLLLGALGGLALLRRRKVRDAV